MLLIRVIKSVYACFSDITCTRDRIRNPLSRPDRCHSPRHSKRTLTRTLVAYTLARVFRLQKESLDSQFYVFSYTRGVACTGERKYQHAHASFCLTCVHMNSSQSNDRFNELTLKINKQQIEDAIVIIM